MKKNIADYYHLYLGQEVEVYFQGTRVVSKITPESLGGFISSSLRYKLLLRPLSDMTDAEREQYLSLHKFNPYFPITSSWAEREESNLKQYSVLTNWCRENSFDIDGLIETGMAIDKTKPPKQIIGTNGVIGIRKGYKGKGMCANCSYSQKKKFYAGAPETLSCTYYAMPAKSVSRNCTGIKSLKATP